MALCEIKYFSTSLQKQTGMYVVIPDGQGPFRVVYQLHGLSDDYSMWLRRTNIERYADSTGLMVVMPDGGRSFYADMVSGGGNYEQHMLETVRYIDRIFPTVANARGRAIGGLSMGGYGAMKLGLKYPDTFCSVASHSGALDMKMNEA
ncbi:MAG: alpha/beta hydrolase-fold protein, partial [bacterium]